MGKKSKAVKNDPWATEGEVVDADSVDGTGSGGGRRRGRRGVREAEDEDGIPSAAADDQREAEGPPKPSPKLSPKMSPKLSPAFAHAQAADAVESFGLKCCHGKYMKVDLNSGDIKATSTNIGDTEKFDIIHHECGAVSLRACNGKHVVAHKNGDVRASQSAEQEESRFQMISNDDGTKSFSSSFGTFLATQKGGPGPIIARSKYPTNSPGNWEKFLLKPRGQSRQARDLGAVADIAVDELTAHFDAFCELELVLAAEERYGMEHCDKTAVAFQKRARARRSQGLDLNFKHFCEQHTYPSSFTGCVSAWDATVVLRPGEHFHGDAEGSRADCGNTATAWQQILATDDAGGPTVYAAFGIPAASAADADEAAFERLEALCRLPRCVAVGPIGLVFDADDFAAAPGPGAATAEFSNRSRAEIIAEFGVPPRKGAYAYSLDPKCRSWRARLGPASSEEDFALAQGDRRQASFEAARACYARRRLESQVAVADRQVRLARSMGKPLVVQLPAQDAAERKMAEVLLAGLGGEGASHRVLLSAFRGRPKCAAALLKTLPGVSIGFSGLLTHKKMQSVLGEIAFDTPLNRCLLESLGPRFPPALPGAGGDSRGSYGHPLHVLEAASGLARIKGISREQVLEECWRNVAAFYNLPSVPGLD